MNDGGYAGDITPQETWETLVQESNAILIDVRTPAEWNYVGIPDLTALGKEPVLVPWVDFPNMQINDRFGEQIERLCADKNAPLLFICRSGVRSKAAAIECTRRGYSRCYNVDTGFEGHHDHQRHRGTVNGWKASGLPWVQG